MTHETIEKYADELFTLLSGECTKQTHELRHKMNLLALRVIDDKMADFEKQNLMINGLDSLISETDRLYSKLSHFRAAIFDSLRGDDYDE